MVVDRQDAFRRILGVNFYVGDVRGAIDRVSRGGLLVVPAAPALKDIDTHEGYREAILNADVVITDSAFMVLAWNGLQRDTVPRLSGLRYLGELLEQPEVRTPGNTLWVMASAASAQMNLKWLLSCGITVPDYCVYTAPIYHGEVEDKRLVERLNKIRMKHVIITVGGGKQEQLGLYLKRNLDYVPAIHCIGAAIAFLSGDQVKIPLWADRLYLGWLIRCLWGPSRYIPRYWSAFGLLPILWRYRDKLPPLRTHENTNAEENG